MYELQSRVSSQSSINRVSFCVKLCCSRRSHVSDGCITATIATLRERRNVKVLVSLFHRQGGCELSNSTETRWSVPIATMRDIGQTFGKIVIEATHNGFFKIVTHDRH